MSEEYFCQDCQVKLKYPGKDCLCLNCKTKRENETRKQNIMGALLDLKKRIELGRATGKIKYKTAMSLSKGFNNLLKAMRGE